MSLPAYEIHDAQADVRRVHLLPTFGDLVDRHVLR